MRGIRRRELFRIASGDVLGQTDVVDVGLGLSRLTDAVLEATLEVAGRAVRADKGLDEAPADLAIVAMGRYGGFELAYASDADVMFVSEPREGSDAHEAATYAKAVANELRRLLKLPMSDPTLEVDADLRPEGKQGPLVRTIDSYAAYYAKWSKVWEFQALLRADAAVGDEGVRRRFTELIDPLRFPADGLSDADIAEVRRIKARVDTERLPRGADPNTHLKLGRGGLADVEWTVQLLQMRFAGQHASLRTPRTLEALAAAAELELIDAEDADVLAHAWRTVSRVRNAITLVRGKPGDHLPRDPREGRGGEPARLRRGRSPTGWSTTTCARPGARTRWSSGCSGSERALGRRVPGRRSAGRRGPDRLDDSRRAFGHLCTGNRRARTTAVWRAGAPVRPAVRDPGFSSASAESRPGSRWYVAGARGRVIVQARSPAACSRCTDVRRGAVWRCGRPARTARWRTSRRCAGPTRAARAVTTSTSRGRAGRATSSPSRSTWRGRRCAAASPAALVGRAIRAAACGGSCGTTPATSGSGSTPPSRGTGTRPGGATAADRAVTKVRADSARLRTKSPPSRLVCSRFARTECAVEPTRQADLRSLRSLRSLVRWPDGARG